MTARLIMTDRAILQRFGESIQTLAESPSAINVVRYLRASTALDGSAPKPRARRT